MKVDSKLSSVMGISIAAILLRVVGNSLEKILSNGRKIALITGLTILCFFTITLALSQTASASEVGNTKRFGIGAMLGSPTGLSMKYYFNPRHALDFGVGVGFWGYAALYVHIDYRYHFMLTKNRDFDLPLFLGVGAKMTLWFNNANHRYWGDKDSHGGYVGVGLRVPLGIAFNLNKIPLDVFMEIVPGVGFFPGIGAFIDGAIGVRYYF